MKVFSFWNQWNQCRLISRAFTVMVEGSIQHAVDDGRSMACCRTLVARFSTLVFHEPPDWDCRQHLDFRPIAVDRADNAWHQESEKSFLRVRTWILVQTSMPGRQTEGTQVWELIASLAHPSNYFTSVGSSVEILLIESLKENI